MGLFVSLSFFSFLYLELFHFVREPLELLLEPGVRGAGAAAPQERGEGREHVESKSKEKKTAITFENALVRRILFFSPLLPRALLESVSFRFLFSLKLSYLRAYWTLSL